MNIGLTAGAATLDKTIEQAVQAEADGFGSLRYASGLLGDPLEAQIRAVFAAGATDLSVFIVPVGPDRRASERRATELLSHLARE